MSSDTFFCNNKKCRKPLVKMAWVTCCSHAFCEDEYNFQESKVHNCVACNKVLSKKYDIVKAVLDPDEGFKSMVLCGLRPDVVLDIANRALMFWNYQMTQEKLYHATVGKNIKNRMMEMQIAYQNYASKVKTDRQIMLNKLQEAQLETEEYKKKLLEMEDKLCEKVREIQRIQAKYESMRRNVNPMSMNLNAGEEDSIVLNQNDMIETMTKKRCADESPLPPPQPMERRISSASQNLHRHYPANHQHAHNIRMSQPSYYNNIRSPLPVERHTSSVLPRPQQQWPQRGSVMSGICPLNTRITPFQTTPQGPSSNEKSRGTPPDATAKAARQQIHQFKARVNKNPLWLQSPEYTRKEFEQKRDFRLSSLQENGSEYGNMSLFRPIARPAR